MRWTFVGFVIVWAITILGGCDVSGTENVDPGPPNLTRLAQEASKPENLFGDVRDTVVIGPDYDGYSEEELRARAAFFAKFAEFGYSKAELLDRSSWWDWDEEKIERFRTASTEANVAGMTVHIETWLEHNPAARAGAGDQPIDIPADALFSVETLPDYGPPLRSSSRDDVEESDE